MQPFIRPVVRRLVLWSLLIGVVPVTAARPLQLVANHWEPYTGEGLPAGGLATEIVQTALQRAGLSSKVTIKPWTRALRSTYRGEADGIVAIWSTAERREQILFSEAIFSNELVLFRRRGEGPRPAGDSDLSHLSGLVVGVGRGYEYSDDFLRASHFKKEPASNALQNLLKLARSRVDVVVEDRRIGEFNLARHRVQYPELQRLEADASPLMRLPLYFGISRKRPDADALMDRFNAELHRMRNDGTLARILDRPVLP